MPPGRPVDLPKTSAFPLLLAPQQFKAQGAIQGWVFSYGLRPAPKGMRNREAAPKPGASGGIFSTGAPKHRHATPHQHQGANG